MEEIYNHGHRFLNKKNGEGGGWEVNCIVPPFEAKVESDEDFLIQTLARFGIADRVRNIWTSGEDVKCKKHKLLHQQSTGNMCTVE